MPGVMCGMSSIQKACAPENVGVLGRNIYKCVPHHTVSCRNLGNMLVVAQLSSSSVTPARSLF